MGWTYAGNEVNLSLSVTCKLTPVVGSFYSVGKLVNSVTKLVLFNSAEELHLIVM